MNSYVIYKKEIREAVKTPRLLIIASLFISFAILSPLTAKFMPLIIKQMGKQVAFLTIPEPTYLDAYMQLFNNMNTIVFLVLIFMLCGTVASEKSKGIIPLIVTKGLSRSSILCGKFLAHCSIYTFIYVISSCIFYIYTIILFPQHDIHTALLSLAIFWLYGIFLIGGVMLASTIARSYGIAALYGFLIYILSSIAASIPYVKHFSPAHSTTLSLQLVESNVINTKDIIPFILSTLVLTMVFMVLSIISFQKQEL